MLRYRLIADAIKMLASPLLAVVLAITGVHALTAVTCIEGAGTGSCSVGHCDVLGTISCSRCAYNNEAPVNGMCTGSTHACVNIADGTCRICASDYLLYRGGCYSRNSSLADAICAPDSQIMIGERFYCSQCMQEDEVPYNGVCGEADNVCDGANGQCETCLETGTFLYQGGCYSLASEAGNIVCATVEDNKCTRCRSGFGFVSDVCEPCHVIGCIDCGSDATTCAECGKDTFPFGSACESCIGEHCAGCSAGQCVDCTGRTECEACGIENCELCLENKCTRCGEGYKLDNGICVPKPAEDCPENCLCTDEKVPAKCTACGPGYYTQSIASSTNCRSCEEGIKGCASCSYLRGTLSCDQCLEGHRLKNGYECTPCGSGCKECPTRADRCASCMEQTPYLTPDKTGCVSTCPENSLTATGECVCADGYYAHGVHCVSCADHCKTCSGGEEDKCVTCRNGYYLDTTTWHGMCRPCEEASKFLNYPGVPHCNACTFVSSTSISCTGCQEGYRLTSEGCVLLETTDCPLNCQCAEGSTECIACAPGYVATESPTAETCLPCTQFLDNCAVCLLDGSIVTCTACHVGYGLVEGECLTCGKGCASCDWDEQQCTACIEQGYKFSLRGDACLQVCPEHATDSYHRCVCDEGYRVSEDGLSCVILDSLDVCPSICTCENDDGVCTGCISGYFEANSTATDSNRCEACTGLTCAACEGEKCTQCAGLPECHACGITACDSCLTDGICTSCKTGFQLEDNECRSIEPICPPGCVCTPGTDVCQRCADGYFKVPVDDSFQCMHCGHVSTRTWIGVANCARCEAPDEPGPAHCTACIDEYFLIDSTPPACVAQCPEGFGPYEDRCLPCDDPYCVSCEHAYDFCEACDDSATLVEGVCRTDCPQGCVCDEVDNTKCVGCLPGYFEAIYARTDDDIISCTPCIQNCASCTDSSSCQTCKPGFFLHPMNNTCVLSCGDGLYGQDGVCVQCPDNCAKCTSQGCIVCDASYYLDEGVCMGCSNTCSTCSGPTSDDCLTCPSGHVHSTGLGPGACLKECSSEAVGNCRICNATLGGSRFCSQCSPGEVPINGRCVPNTLRAVLCDSDGSGICTSCLGASFLHVGGCYEAARYPGNSVCTSAEGGLCKACSSEYVLLDGVCSSCARGCQTCASLAAGDCNTCTEGYFAAFTTGMGHCKSCNDITTTNGFSGLTGCKACDTPSTPGPAICRAWVDGAGPAEDTATGSEKKGLSGGAIAGIVIAVVLVLGGVVGGLCAHFICCKRIKGA
ncbi:High cysteine membrane protein [Giardia muris]|uniref:High cysteine membrane protein n=1 Tax=Giardia muris TaxID=5742 RepID=A0A4Z1TA50_GIAMU|nr:High cysteine membrane protein [Giardia muris]|eukprot:TNJ29401.1 High cysteine membrane protein [Giardia muris]